MHWTETAGEPGFKDLLRSLSKGIGALLKQEVEFAKVEVSKQMAHARTGVIFLAAGAMLGFSGFLVLLAAAVAALAHVVPLWLSALLVGLAIVIAGGILLWSGKNELKAEKLKPQKTIDVVKEDISWMKSQLS
jgi:protein-S-isoprenylcysteine O-methyltransferase Ste14